MTLDTPCY